MRAALLRQQRSCSLPCQGRTDRSIHRSGVQAIPGQCIALQRNLKDCHASLGLEFDFRRARDILQKRLHLLSQLFQDVVVLSENFDRDVGPNSLKHFVEPHFNRLRDQNVTLLVLPFDLITYPPRQFWLRRYAIIHFPPFHARTVRNVEVCFVRRHWVRCHFARADSRENPRNLRKFLTHHFICMELPP